MRSPQLRNTPSSGMQAEPAAVPAPAKKRSALIPVLLVTALGSALGVRVWHDRQAGSLSSSNLSISAIEQRAKQAPDDLDTQIAWANALAQQGKTQQAMTVFAHCARLKPNDARSYAGLAGLAIQEERWDIARVNLREAAKYNPADADVWHTLGGLYMRAKKWGPALDAYTHASQLRPTDALAWRQRGMLEMQASLAGRGHESLAHAVALDPQDAEAWYALGLSDVSAGQLDEARKAFETVLAQRPEDAQAEIQLLHVDVQLHPTPQNLDQAQKRLTRLLPSDRTGTAQVVQGHIFLMQRKYKPAIDALKTGLAVDKNQPTAYVYLSQAYAATGQQALARQASAAYQQITAHKTASPTRR